MPCAGSCDAVLRGSFSDPGHRPVWAFMKRARGVGFSDLDLIGLWFFNRIWLNLVLVFLDLLVFQDLDWFLMDLDLVFRIWICYVALTIQRCIARKPITNIWAFIFSMFEVNLQQATHKPLIATQL